MQYELKFEVEGEILFVEIFGERPKKQLEETSKDAWRTVAKVASEKNLKKLLILSHVTGDYPTFDAYKINSTLEECGVQRGWLIAFVNLDSTSYQEIKFAETVAVNRGFKIEVFSNQENARDWLQKPF